MFTLEFLGNNYSEVKQNLLPGVNSTVRKELMTSRRLLAYKSVLVYLEATDIAAALGQEEVDWAILPPSDEPESRTRLSFWTSRHLN